MHSIGPAIRPTASACWPSLVVEATRGAGVVRCVRVVTVRSVRVVVRSSVALRWPTGVEVLPVSTRGSPGWRQARWGGEVLTVVSR
jgi:hypothetical protein